MTVPDTDRYQSLLRLTASQVSAVEALDAGSTHADAAQTAGVNRVTVTRWVHHHPAFQAELNRRRLERLERLAARADSVTVTALDVIAQAIDTGDVASALAWIRMTYTHVRATSKPESTSKLPLTPAEVIQRETETLATREPMLAFTNIYRGEAVDQICAALGQND
jgi:hypothetical protein